jgi:hypothetical protein
MPLKSDRCRNDCVCNSVTHLHSYVMAKPALGQNFWTICVALN